MAKRSTCSLNTQKCGRSKIRSCSPAGAGCFDFDRLFAEAVRRAGIEAFRFHDLRHSAASYLAMSGATLSEIAAVLGHKTLAMVKRYSHLSEDHTAGVVERMARKFQL